MQLELVRPSLDREQEFMAMVEEFVSVGEQEYVFEEVLFSRGFAAYLEWLTLGERGALPGLAPWSAYWAVDASNELVGISSLRHSLSAWLAEFGGHIGYRVRPSMRRRGAGSQLLALTLEQARSRGIAEALVVCTPENEASQGVLRKNGAVFEREVLAEGLHLRRYFVPTRAASAMQSHNPSIERTS